MSSFDLHTMRRYHYFRIISFYQMTSPLECISGPTILHAFYLLSLVLFLIANQEMLNDCMMLDQWPGMSVHLD